MPKSGITFFCLCTNKIFNSMAHNLFNRYIWLVDTVYRAGSITFEEVNERWLRTEMSEGKEIPLRTFHNHREAIEQMFDINIECNRHGGFRYYIEHAEDMERGGVRRWLLNTFAVNNLINESHKLKRRILFEKIPSGQKFLTPIIEAMRDGVLLEMTYQGYWSDVPKTFQLEPYCVKVFKQRWYVVGRNPCYEEPRIYALDRVQALDPTTEKFKMPKSFDPEAFFSESFGVIVGDGCEAEEVQIKVRGAQVSYIRALPLHHSQEEVKIEHDFSIFRYYIKPSFDFKQELLSHGAAVEVLEPKWVRDEMAEDVREMSTHYKK